MPPIYDVVVVGGGITGAGVARDCAMRGLSTLLLERGAPGMATTASSTHLIHGGLRYLLYDRPTTAATCLDSGLILRIASTLLRRLPILWPVYRGQAHGIEAVETLLEAYDPLSEQKGGKRHLRLDAEQTLRLLPGLSRQGLLGCVSFDEWWVDPVALVKANLDSARRHGAEILVGAAVTGMLRGPAGVEGVAAPGFEARAAVTVNAAGPWIDQVGRLAQARVPLRLRKGTHLRYEAKLAPFGLLLEAADRRYVFVIPSPQGTLVGPTDLPAANPDSAATQPEEVAYLLRTVRRYFPSFPERFDATTVGSRPILSQAGGAALLSRDFAVFDHQTRDGIGGLVTIGGGKMSDFRAMAEAATDLVCAKLGRSLPCTTSCETLDGRALERPPENPRAACREDPSRRHPRLRQAQALGRLAIGFSRHLARRALLGRPTATAEDFRDYYAG
ncbi:MAG: FAD-dependent oxidoreductase [Elusimicrobia bacterium]|nr:FAD-dependent oxidoreductase [Elusimicrobiota bacterium]MDE2237908.1 FAD-dependent oxidoreductase [Elusimicrobiota bacterium]MDE2426155.1 FAD-dependent oxidoreductase [Elusimicrobiota bacterium]